MLPQFFNKIHINQHPTCQLCSYISVCFLKVRYQVLSCCPQGFLSLVGGVRPHVQLALTEVHLRWLPFLVRYTPVRVHYNSKRERKISIIFYQYLQIFITPARQKSKTLSTIDERGSKIKTTVFLIFDCHLSPMANKWQTKTLYLLIFYLRSSMVLAFSIPTYLVCSYKQYIVDLFQFQ